MCKTYSPYVLLSALLFLLVSEAQAFTCKSSDGGVIPEGGSNTPVPLRVKIGPNLVNGKMSYPVSVKFLVKMRAGVRIGGMK